MPYDRHPLLCELHAHTTWSDGSLSLPELVDLYGNAGFDVLCVTDHSSPAARRTITSIRATTATTSRRSSPRPTRALDAYDLLVIPGLELTYDHDRPEQSAHGVAVGLREHVRSTRGSRRRSREHATPVRR